MIKVCQALPDPVGNSCKNWLRKYGDIIIDTLNNFTPKEVCQKIQACTTLGGLLLTPEMHMNLAQPEPARKRNSFNLLLSFSVVELLIDLKASLLRP